MKSVAIGMGFAIILIVLCLLLFKDSKLFEIVNRFVKKSREIGVTAAVIDLIREKMQKDTPKTLIIEINGEKVKKEVLKYPFYIGKSEWCNLRLHELRELEVKLQAENPDEYISFSNVHGVIDVVRRGREMTCVFKNLNHSPTTEYYDATDDGSRKWFNMWEYNWWRKLIHKPDTVELKLEKQGDIEQFYLEKEISLVITAKDMPKKVLSKETIDKYKNVAKTRRTESKRTKVKEVFEDEEIEC